MKYILCELISNDFSAFFFFGQSGEFASEHSLLEGALVPGPEVLASLVLGGKDPRFWIFVIYLVTSSGLSA